ncbi:MAG: hypothetical protein WAQ52_07915 [Terriglobales bacterium]
MSKRKKSNSEVQLPKPLQEERNMKTKGPKQVSDTKARTLTITKHDYRILWHVSMLPMVTMKEIESITRGILPAGTTFPKAVQSLTDRGLLFSRSDYPELVALTSKGAAMRHAASDLLSLL